MLAHAGHHHRCGCGGHRQGPGRRRGAISTTATSRSTSTTRTSTCPWSGRSRRRSATPGARLHTGRSRNDQVATDDRLFAKHLCDELIGGLCARLRQTLIDQAEKHFDVILPGYTHMQHAQPVLFSHHMLAYFWMFSRDFDAPIRAARRAADVNPLGSAALAGTTYPLDRHMTADLLGFSACHAEFARCRLRPRLPPGPGLRVRRGHDAPVAPVRGDRAVVHVRVRLHRRCPTRSPRASSIMPQKKNPDFAELIARQDRPRRGRPGGAAGHHEVAAPCVQQGPAGGQGGRHRRREDAA